jgi:hypothetical protein
VTLPGPIPAKNFWSFTVYDNQTRSLLPTDQKLAGVDSTLPDIQKSPDGGVTVWFGPKAPPGHEGNWVQTMPGKGYNVALRLYGPLERGSTRPGGPAIPNCSPDPAVQVWGLGYSVRVEASRSMETSTATR